MSNQVEAIYENGVFRPLSPVELPEHQRVTVQIPEKVAGTPKSQHDTGGNSTNNTKTGNANISEAWTEEKNARRCDLIDKEIEGTITAAEKAELEALQQQAIAHRDRIAPLPMEGALKLHQELLRKKRASQG